MIPMCRNDVCITKEEYDMARRSEGNLDYTQQIANLLQNGLQAEFAEKSYRAWLRGAERVRSEALDLFNARIDKGIAAATDLARCATPVDALQVQARYASDAFNDYVVSGKRIVEVIGEIARDELNVAAEAGPAVLSEIESEAHKAELHLARSLRAQPHRAARSKRRATKRANGNGHTRASK
jgi:hypothetical protein